MVVIIGASKGLSPIRRQVITETNTQNGMNFTETLIKMNWS